MAENAPRPAERWSTAAERNDRVLDVSFNHRRRGDVQALKKIIDAGVLGTDLLRQGRLAAARGHPRPGQLVHPAGHRPAAAR